MTRLDNTLHRLRTNGRKALITFMMAGDPDPDISLDILHALAGQADILEIGMPFSDPMADGPVIQAAGLRALKAGMGVRKTFDLVRAFRQKNGETPVILMGYLNPILKFGTEAFCAACRDAGVDGLIVVDMPPEETPEMAESISKGGLTLIRLVAPTTDADRLGTVLDGAGGFLYFVSITGVTGTATADPRKVGDAIAKVRAVSNLPVMAGFGIRNAADVRALKDVVDGVIVGSSLVDIIAKNDGRGAIAEIGALAAELRTALDEV